MPISLESANVGPIGIAVVLTLLAMSVASFAIAIDRGWTLRRAIRDSRAFAREVHPLIRKGDWVRAQGTTAGWQARQAPLALVTAAGLAEWLAWSPEDDDRALGAAREAAAFAADMSLAEMRRGLTVLATIGSTAPFVGLFGTTFGIIHAFSAMAVTGSAAIGAISAGISEALVTTAFGLFVAIPAVWAYNAFLGRIEFLRVELDRGRFVLIEQLARR